MRQLLALFHRFFPKQFSSRLKRSAARGIQPAAIWRRIENPFMAIDSAQQRTTAELVCSETNL